MDCMLCAPSRIVERVGSTPPYSNSTEINLSDLAMALELSNSCKGAWKVR